MEDLPRIPKSPEDDAESSELPVPQTESLMSRWQKMISSQIQDKESEKKGDKEDDDEDEEESDETTDNSVEKNKSERLKNKLRAFMPQAEKLDPVETELKSDEIDQDTAIMPSTEDYAPVASLDGMEVGLQSYDVMPEVPEAEPAENYIEKPFSTGALVATSVEEHIIEPNEALAEEVYQSNKPTQEEIYTPRNTDIAPAIEPQIGPRYNDPAESIQQILQRKDDSLGTGKTSGDYARPISSVQPEARQYDRNPTGMLLAVDAANYIVARRRDKKNMEKVDTELAKVRHEHASFAESENKRLSKHLIQQDKNEQVVKELRQEKARPQRRQELGLNNNSKQENKQIIEKKLEVPHAVVQERLMPTSSVNVEKRETATTIQNFNETLYKVAEAGPGKIKSEFEFERRHEVMDEPGDRTVFNTPQSPEFGVSSSSQPTSHSSTRGASISPKVTDEKLKASTSAVYKQAATTGFWGALVGIIVFLIIYMLSKG